MSQNTENLTQCEVILQSWFLAFACIIAMLEVYLSNMIEQFRRPDLKVQVIQKSFTISYINVENPGHST